MTTLSKLERVPLRVAWKHEAADFTPWLAEEENLALPADTLDLSELALVATEHPVGKFKLDILCSSNEETVIIENQLEKTNHGHLGQILTYAAGTDARIGDSPLAPKFEVVIRPNDWVKAEREQTRAASHATLTKQRQLRLWTKLVDSIGNKAPHIRPQKPRPQYWLNNTIGRSGFGLNPTVNSRDDTLGVEIHISHPESKRMFQQLLEQKPTIEEALGFELNWLELPDAHACRIATWRPDSSLEDEDQWCVYLDWFLQRLMKMDTVFRPIIQALS